MTDATVRLQALDGGWEVVGRDRLARIKPEGIQCSANPWGSDTCRFTLRRDPRAVHPDLGAFTPCEVEVGGQLVWSGRVWETPTKEGSDAAISVEGRGWQYHLDDDVYSRLFVHARLDDWKDLRGLLGNTAVGRIGTAAGQVAVDSGAILIAWPKGAQVAATNPSFGAVLDLGPNLLAKRIVLTYRKESATATVGQIRFSIKGNDTDDVVAITQEQSTNDITALSASGTLAFTFTTARRYVSLQMVSLFGANTTLAEDETIRITSCLVFANTAHESGNASILKVSDIVKDALPVAPLLNQSTARISATSFNVPDAFWLEAKTPREIISAYNAYHNYRTRVDVDALLRFDPLPSVPLYEAGPWQGVEFEDASANSGESIYNRVRVEGTGPDGSPLLVARRTSDSSFSGINYDVAPIVLFPNPGFETNTANWTVSAGTLTRTTVAGEFHSGTGGGKWTGQGYNNTLLVSKVSWDGTFKKGVTYAVTFWAKTSANSRCQVLFGTGAGVQWTDFYTTTAWTQFVITWMPTQDIADNVVNFGLSTNTGTFGTAQPTLFVDDFAVGISRPTLPDRRGFTRTAILPVESAITAVEATQLGDVFLTNHKTTPLRGGMTVTPGGLRAFGGGSKIHPSVLLTQTQEVVRFLDRVDPDTGAQGRDGRIASVNYDHDSETATVAIDNERRNFEALLARYDLIVGSGR